MSRTGEPHRGLGRLFVRKRTRWPHLWARTPRPSGLMEPRPQGLRPWQPLPHRAHAHQHHPHPFLVASISGEKRIVHAKTSAPPQRSEHAGTVGGIRRRQVPWMIAARSWSRRLLGLAGPGLTPPCPWQRAHEHGWQESSVCSSLISDIGPAIFRAQQSAGMISNFWRILWY